MTAEVSVAINHGRVYADGQVFPEAQVLIDGEKIVAVLPGSNRGTTAARTIDASGCVVLPGVIDTHSHHRDPGFTYKEDITSATRAAAAGGVTVTIGMPNVDPPTTTVARYRELVESQGGRAIVDFNHNPAPTELDEIAGLAEAGALAFKVFMVVDSQRTYPHMPGLGVHDNGKLLEVAEAVNDSGRVLMVHPNDQSVLDVLERRAWAAGDFSYRNYAMTEASLDGIAWNSAVAALVEIQSATGVPLHVLHVMGPRMMELTRHARRLGQDVTTEVNPFALFLSNIDEVDRLGPYGLGRCLPQEWVGELWAGIREGDIDILGSDHAPHSHDEKELGWVNMWKAPSGTPQLQHFLPRLLTEAVKGTISVEDVVRITATNPAKRFGLFPKKGTLRAGSDADVVIVNLGTSTVINDDDVMSKAGYSPYRGQALYGLPVYTLVRGTVVFERGAITVAPGFGQVAKAVSTPEAANVVASCRGHVGQTVVAPE